MTICKHIYLIWDKINIVYEKHLNFNLYFKWIYFRFFNREIVFWIEFRPKEQATQSAKKPKSSKASEASKAREESRKRLMAAKMAGRQRKASETEEEIQIFIS